MDLNHKHPLVIAEYEYRREIDPETCNYPFGAVHVTAQRPNPQWCARPLNHIGPHMPIERYQEYKALATARQQGKRKRDNGSV